MGDLTKKVNYLKGLADGMELKGDTQEQKLLLQMLDVLEGMAEEIEDLAESQEDMEEYLEDIEEDLSELEDAVYEDDDEEYEDDEDDEDGDEDGEIAGDSLVEYECPHCGFKTGFDITDFDFEEDYLCPECQQPFFPEHEEEEGGDDGEDNGEDAPKTR